MTERRTLPVLALRETVVFPHVAVPISAGRPATVQAIEAAMANDRRLFAVCQMENRDEIEADNLHAVGVIVKIMQVQRAPGVLQLLIQGERRARPLEYTTKDEMLEAVVETIPEVEPEDPWPASFVALDRELRDRAVELGRRRGIPSEALRQLAQGIEKPGAFADLVAFYLEVPAEEKQKLLEEVMIDERMRRVLIAVERDLMRLEAQEEIQQQVQEELGEKQREMMLREQLKAIQKELGEDDEAGALEDLRERVAKLELNDDARQEIERELSRLERTHPQSAEYQVIRTFLDWVTDLPWGTRTDDHIDLAQSEAILAEDHYGLEDVKDRVLEFLAVRKLQMERAAEEVELDADAADAGRDAAVSGPEIARDDIVGSIAVTDLSSAHEALASIDEGDRTDGDSDPLAPPPDAENEKTKARAKAVGRGPILLFVGPPGVGKTSIAQGIARALGRKYVRIALGGARDEADIRGHRRTYVGAMPGRIIQGLKQAGTKNPVFLLDEVDKLGVSMQGDPSSALLEVLDPAQNNSFVDHYLGIPFDLSEVLFIATANYRDRIPAPLLDRMEMVDFAGYTEQEKLEIAKRYLLPRQRRESGLKDEQLAVEDGAIRRVVSEYTREAGVRQLERELGKLARKAARRVATSEADAVQVGPDEITTLLGRPRVHPERANTSDTVGVATGMYYTPMGGDIMFVEASVSAGKDNLILTGQLGDVMKESARAALTYARTHRHQLGIPEDRFKDIEIHIHVPAGAVPKDGPSAGITMATALVSALSNRPVRPDVAMTGEITLSGRVLPIGGLKEKVLGAHRAGIKEIILPADNEADLEDLPAEVRNELMFHTASELGQVLAITLRGAKFEGGTLSFPAEVDRGGPRLHH
ncbi:MAG TPA: endopeptidase La [Longimicrobiales bacterium]